MIQSTPFLSTLQLHEHLRYRDMLWCVRFNYGMHFLTNICLAFPTPTENCFPFLKIACLSHV